MPASLLSRFHLLASRPPRPPRHAFHYDFVLGTSLDLQVMARDPRAVQRAERAVLGEVERLDGILSGWSAVSELARWCATSDVDVAVSPELAEVLATAQMWRARTSGAFDPGAGALAALLRANAPAPEIDVRRRALLDALRGPHWSVDRIAGTARRLGAHAISLDAIAKGYIVSRAAACARDVEGVAGVLLNIGGDVQ
ncbi:MAG TPA: FAD:protein FMN transferase, partial [Gemmatimonadaceae bacterium]|nr:FAD:protein FMN transferase [Gemmatimonadaceae bacterium]